MYVSNVRRKLCQVGKKSAFSNEQQGWNRNCILSIQLRSSITFNQYNFSSIGICQFDSQLYMPIEIMYWIEKCQEKKAKFKKKNDIGDNSSGGGICFCSHWNLFNLIITTSTAYTHIFLIIYLPFQHDYIFFLFIYFTYY